MSNLKKLDAPQMSKPDQPISWSALSPSRRQAFRSALWNWADSKRLSVPASQTGETRMDSTEPDMPGDFGAISVPLDIAGSPCGPLCGTRFAVKENIEVAGTVSSNGNPVWAASHPPAALNAPVIDRLLAAGGRLVGKAHMDEMAYSLLGANAHYGTPVNPAAKDRHPGGSSSGPAAAVAAGLDRK